MKPGTGIAIAGVALACAWSPAVLSTVTTFAVVAGMLLVVDLL